MTTDPVPADRFRGALLGCALGDSLGLPREGLSRLRAQRLLGKAEGAAGLAQAFFLGRGVVSDDTDHSCLTGLAVLRSQGEVERFRHAWAGFLRGWVWSMPYGVGYATLQAGLKLSLGFGSRRSGVFSAGNGPAMRSPILGVLFAGDPERRVVYVEASATVSHTDPRAVDGAQLVAQAAAILAQEAPGEVAPDELMETLVANAATEELRERLSAAVPLLKRDGSPLEYLEKLGLEAGVGGFVLETVPGALFVALRHLAEPAKAIASMIECGGDTDTTAAIVGALVGSHHGPDAFPEAWSQGLVAWPYTRVWRERLVRALIDGGFLTGTSGSEGGDPGSRLGLLPLRHFTTLPVVLGHVARRMLPPY